MTLHSVKLEDFGPDRADAMRAAGSNRERFLSTTAIEAIRAEGYEVGYKCGWDDAVGAAENERRVISEELSRNLRDLGFTYFEARDELLVGLKAFLNELLESLFSSLLTDSVAAAIAEELSGIAGDGLDGDVSILVSPEDADAIRALLPLSGHPELTVREEIALAPGQARLVANTHEIAIDAVRLLERIRSALAAASDKVDEVISA